MNVQCSHCNTVFRVDPAKVPAAGLRARCSICRGIFDVPGANGNAASASTAAVASAPATASAAVPAAAPTPAPRVEAPVAAPSPAPRVETPLPAPRPAPAPAAPPAAQAPAPAASPSAFGTRPPPSFGSTDPAAKARRLARALVSDIVTYHPERRDKALGDGTLKREFMEEIKKSWEEYVEQVGPEMARSTPHFRDALNEILAKGQALF
ncbi:MAG: family finger-like protein [Gemmatimonadetes bacterium]|nr:family finger-like protein [Gemmatimonadota bacterium]